MSSSYYPMIRLSFKRFVFFIILIFIAGNTMVFSQKKSDYVDTTFINKHKPWKATLMSAILPGLGQIYNRKYWKAPIIYAGIAIDYHYIMKWDKKYDTFLTGYSFKTQSPDSDVVIEGSKYPIEALKAAKDQYRKWRDGCVIAMVGIYLLNIIDANVDAHLFSFDVSDDLSLNFEPCIFHTYQPAMGLSVRLNFK